MEIKNDSESWKPLVRYDSAHGYFHRDLIHSDGAQEKDKIKPQICNNVIDYGIEDFKENFKVYMKKTGYSNLSQNLSFRKLDEDLEKARKSLLKLVNNPKRVKKIPNKHTMKLKEALDTFKENIRATEINKNTIKKILQILENKHPQSTETQAITENLDREKSKILDTLSYLKNNEYIKIKEDRKESKLVKISEKGMDYLEEL